MNTQSTQGVVPVNGSGTAPRIEVTLISGVYAHYLSLSPNVTVGDVRGCWQERFNIAPDAFPVIDGTPADEETPLKNGQVLIFVRAAGEMGGTPLRPSEWRQSHE